jgi:hypothetical protein
MCDGARLLPLAFMSVTIRSMSLAALSVTMLAVTPVSSALAAGSGARPASRSERSAIVAAFTASDGNSSEVHGVYVSQSNSSLAVVCARTPEAGTRAYVFSHSRSWRYVTSGQVGRAGNSADRRLEQACG